MQQIEAKIIADSKNEFGNRITTFLLTFPRIILAEVNTHRMLSRNSASSRAIPFEKMLKRVQEDPFIPIKWMKDHKGMQGVEYFTETAKEAWIHQDRSWGYEQYADVPAVEFLKKEWLQARDWAVMQAQWLSDRGLTKQICNRLLEPFMWHTAIVTGTEWENFFALRAHEAAEIHLQELAYKMLEEYNNSTPQLLSPGQWHIPFGDQMDENRLYALLKGEDYHTEETRDNALSDLQVKIATARCARLSYLNYEGKDDYEADLKLHDSLSAAGHWSAFEHCARSMDNDEYHCWTSGFSEVSDHPDMLGWCGNYRGYIQYRKLFSNENRTDDRVITK
jgi:thymidylate synthase ThyX